MDNTITVLKLLLTYMAVAWILIGISLAMVRSLSINTKIQIQRNAINRRNDITARQNHYRRVA